MAIDLSQRDAEANGKEPLQARASERAVTAPVDRNMAERIDRCRAAARAAAAGDDHHSLQLFDLTRLRARAGSRWDGLRPRAIAMIEAGLMQERRSVDLVVHDGGERLFVVRSARERREIEREAELLAAQVTARLCGTIPAGAIIGVATISFDPDRALAGAISADDLLAHFTTVWSAAGRGAPAASPTSALLPRYRPILHLRKRLVSAYRLIPGASDGRAATSIEAALGEELDAWALRQTADLLLESRRCHEPALVVPVHYASLAGMRSREQLMHGCRQLLPRSSRQLVFELIGLPLELPQARARELLGYLHPFCLAVLVRLPRLTREIGNLANSGARGICLTASAALGQDAMPAPSLAALAGMARISGLRSMLADIASPPTCRAAAAAGIDHVCGDGLMPPLRRPGRAFVIG